MKKLKGKTKLICNHCGKEFYLYFSQTKKGGGKFCSKNCMDNSRKNGNNLICFYCGKEFYRAKVK